MKILKSSYGLNLPELLVALVIMALAVITITGMFMAGMMGRKKGDNMVLATNIAQSTLEIYEKEILCSFDIYDASSSPYTLPDIESDNMKFSRKMFIQDIIDAGHPINKMKKLEISVYWYEKNMEGKRSNSQKELKFSTYVENYLAIPTKGP